MVQRLLRHQQGPCTEFHPSAEEWLELLQRARFKF